MLLEHSNKKTIQRRSYNINDFLHLFLNMSTIFPNYCLKDTSKCCMESDCEPGSLNPCLHCQYWKPSLILYKQNNIETLFSNAFGVDNNDRKGKINTVDGDTNKCGNYMKNIDYQKIIYNKNNKNDFIINDIMGDSGNSYSKDKSIIEPGTNNENDIISISENKTMKQQEIRYTTLSMIKKFEDMRRKTQVSHSHKKYSRKKQTLNDIDSKKRKIEVPPSPKTYDQKKNSSNEIGLNSDQKNKILKPKYTKCNWCNEIGEFCHGKRYGSFLDKYITNMLSSNQQNKQNIKRDAYQKKFYDYYHLLNEFNTYGDNGNKQNKCCEVPKCLEVYKKKFKF